MKNQGHRALTTSMWWMRPTGMPGSLKASRHRQSQPATLICLVCLLVYVFFWFPCESPLTPDKNNHETFCLLPVTPTHHTHTHMYSPPWQTSQISHELGKTWKPCFPARFSNRLRSVWLLKITLFWRLNNGLKASAAERNSLCPNSLSTFSRWTN